MNRKRGPTIGNISDQLLELTNSTREDVTNHLSETQTHPTSSSDKVDQRNSEVLPDKRRDYREAIYRHVDEPSPIPPSSLEPVNKHSGYTERKEQTLSEQNTRHSLLPGDITYHHTEERGLEPSNHNKESSSCKQETMSADSCFESQSDSCSIKALRNVQSEREESKYANKKITINISGTLFQPTLKTLLRFPSTRLSDLASACIANPSSLDEEFYYERNPAAFADIMEFYRSGDLHLDQAKCGAIFKQELEFWGIEKGAISMCCWSNYDTHRATTKMYAELERLFDDGSATVAAPGPGEGNCWSRVHFYIFHTLENPSFSVSAKIFSIVSMIITFVSIFTFVAETHYVFQQIKLANGTRIPAPAPNEPTPKGCCCEVLLQHMTNHGADATLNVTHNETELEHSFHDDRHVDGHLIFHFLDFFTFGYFVFEILIRFTFAYDKRLFCRSAMNVVEVICICAHFISIIEHRISVDGETTHDLSMSLIFILRSLRIMRVARIFKLFRHMTGFKVLVYTIVVSIYELLLIISFLFAGVLIFASIIHYAEEETFPNIPFAIWWALVTMTTVGYGDITPKSSLGYFIGAMCVVAGILVIAFTVPVVVNNFTLYYSVCKSRQARLKMIHVGTVTQKVATAWKSRALKTRNSYNLEI